MARKGSLSRNTRLSICQTDYKRLLAYRRLGIDPGTIEQSAFFRADLLRIRRLVSPKRDASKPSSQPVGLLDALYLSDDPDAKKVVRAYNSVPASYRRLLPPEAFCQAAGVSPWKILQIVASVEIWKGAQASAVVALAALPNVAKKIVERALAPDGFNERRLLFRATGFPTGDKLESKSLQGEAPGDRPAVTPR